MDSEFLCESIFSQMEILGGTFIKKAHSKIPGNDGRNHSKAVSQNTAECRCPQPCEAALERPLSCSGQDP